ncbi:hypothetical protein VTL71DRAFT_7150 [Oculimacula yallundae]|uniref:cutinase n=1 Tax=Oculimacula yallundae TaxID=86028 RepID=A0ABR4BWQ0_9HELO
MLSSSTHLFPFILSILTLLSTTCHASPTPSPNPGINIASSILQNLETLLDKASNGSLAAGLGAFLGDHGTVVFQNGFRELGMMGRNGTGTGKGMDGVNGLELGMDGVDVMRMKCPRLSVIFARGTGEPGNVGILTGPPFFAALAEYMNGTNHLAIQGVDYEAQPAGFFAGGSMNGAAKMASLTTLSLTACPTTPLLLSGYSQGAQIIHLAASLLPANTTSKISSIIMFGDPKNGTKIQGVDERRVKTFCHEGDDICRGGNGVKRDHLNYVKDVRAAAEWGMRIVGGEGGMGILS